LNIHRTRRRLKRLTQLPEMAQNSIPPRGRERHTDERDHDQALYDRFSFGDASRITRTFSSLTLAWDPNTEPDIAGYKLYCGEASGRYIASIDVGNVTQFQPTLKNLNPGDKAFFVVSAYNTSGLESDYSNEVSYTKPALPQPTLEISVDAFGMVQLAWVTYPGLFYTVWYKDNFDERGPAHLAIGNCHPGQWGKDSMVRSRQRNAEDVSP
jgi:hypothetical protein